VANFRRLLGKEKLRFNFVRGLRFRLAAGFLVVLTVLLCGLGWLFREMLVSIDTEQSEAILGQEWATVKGYLRIENERPVWYYDSYDPEEAFIVDRTKHGWLLTDANGNILQRAPMYERLPSLSVRTIRARIRQIHQTGQPIIDIEKDTHGTAYMLYAGLVTDPQHRDYYASVARSMDDPTFHTINKFAWRYFAVVPLLVVFTGVLGWLLAGPALKPLITVSHEAQKVSGSNLNVRIPLRGAGDELDHLITVFNRMIERLNRSFEQMRQFSTDVSHELRTPLTAIRGQLEVALFTAETPEQYRDAMINALQDVEQLSNIVRALLLLSQAESGQLVLQMEPMDLAGVVRDIVDQFQIPAEAAQVSLTCRTPPECLIRGDRVQMARLVSNLLSNAVKYTPEGGSVEVGLECDRGGEGDAAEDGDVQSGTARLWVGDTGIGIPGEKLPHIFDRFYRVRPTQSNPAQGLGLGLSFVAWIVNEHRGKINVDSDEGRGTRFTVLLPLLEPASGHSEKVTIAQEKS
jgi:heavy metal sensor kinase